MKVLLLANDCNPDWPSLPVVGYKYANAIAKIAEVTVATHVRNRKNIERDGLGNARVVYIDSEAIASPFYKLAVFLRGGRDVAWTIQMAMNYPSYLYFEYLVWRTFKTAIHLGEFDIVHRITPMTPTIPSPMAKWSPVPFVLGPLNGNLAWPRVHADRLKREKERLTVIRNAYKQLPFYRSALKKSACILAAFGHTVSDIPVQFKDKTINFPEVGIDPELFHNPIRVRNNQQTILFAGRLVPYKMADVVVKAFANSSLLQRHKLKIIGDGPDRAMIGQIIADNRLEGIVDMVGKVSQSEVGQAMREADIFAFPSIRELGAGVVLEAMACGLPCVVVDYGGPGTLVDADRGIKVPMTDSAGLVANVQRGLESLVLAPDECARLGANAYQHAIQYYSWDAKAQKTIEIYDWVIGKATMKPDFWSNMEGIR